MAKKDHKKPKSSIPLTLSKSPKALPLPSLNEQRPAWRIELVEMCDPFGWHKVDAAKFAEIRQKLIHLERLTWNEILVRDKYWNHTVQRSDLSKEARDRLAVLQLDDQEEFVSLRLSNLERVWGIRLEGAMTLIWWDPYHQVCPSLKKHT